jgi:hypothetical protein
MQTGFIAAMACTTAFAVAAMEFSPKNPTPCQPITLKVPRAFDEDCQWQAEPHVRRDGKQIDVDLTLRGNAVCDQAMTERTFEIRIGSLPAGDYEVFVHWSDRDAAEAISLTVSRSPDE